MNRISREIYEMHVKKLSRNVQHFTAIYYVLLLAYVNRREASRIREMEKKAIHNACKLYNRAILGRISDEL